MENGATINTTVAEGGTITSTFTPAATISSTITGGATGATGATGAAGATGATGATGAAGPNTVTTSTTTNITGILKGNGSTVAEATSDTDYQAPISLTTTGSSGAATFSGNTLNVPEYSGSSGLTVGTTTVGSGTSGEVLYDNGGTLGQLANTGTGSNVLASSPTLGGVTTFPVVTSSSLGLAFSNGTTNSVNFQGYDNGTSYAFFSTNRTYNTGGWSATGFYGARAGSVLELSNDSFDFFQFPTSSNTPTLVFQIQSAGGGVIVTGPLISASNASAALGSSSIYWTGVYATTVYLNSTAYLSGGTAGTIALTGTLTADATSIITDTTTGLKIATATSQKLGFFNATPVAQQSATGDLGTILSNLGLRASGTAYPITTSGTVTLTGSNAYGTPASITLTNATSLPIGGISATGTASSTTYLRGDGSWSTPSGGGVSASSPNTWSAAQTYNAGELLDKGEIVFDVKAYGATGNGSTDDTTDIQAAINACNTAGGGTVWFPEGTYKISTNPLKLYSGTTPSIVGYQNITLAGAGSSGTGGSVIQQTTTGVDVIKGLNDVANGAQALNITVKDLCLDFGGTATNSGNGIYLAQQAAGGPSFQGFTFENVSATDMQGSGKYGFNFESIIVSTLTNCVADSCANGFYLNGQAGGAYDSVGTSVTLTNCYANMATNGVIGYNCQDNTYISFVSCACDIGANTTGQGYKVGGSSSISFYACGCELDGTHSLTDMWYIGADAASNGSSQIGIYNCYGFQSKSTVDVLVTGTTTGVTIIGFQDNSTISGSTGIEVDAGSQATAIDCDVSGAATPLNIASTGALLTPGVTRTVATTSSTTPTPNCGAADEYDVTALAAAATFGAPTGTAVNGQKLLIRIKDNATARALSWNSAYAASGVAPLMTTTVISKTHTCLFVYNSTTSKWVQLAVDATGY